MVEFARFLANYFVGIFNVLNKTYIRSDDSTIVASLGSILFACLVIGFVASLFWKGVKA